MTRFHLRTLRFAKAKAADLKAKLAFHDVETDLTSCQAALARAYGYRDWAELKFITNRGADAPSSLDEEVGSDERLQRRSEQVNAIMRAFRLERGVAHRVNASVLPTALRVPQPEPGTLAEAFAEATEDWRGLTLVLEERMRQALIDECVHANDETVQDYAQGRGIDEITDIDFRDEDVRLRGGVIEIDGSFTVVFYEWSHGDESYGEGFSFNITVTPSDIRVVIDHPEY